MVEKGNLMQVLFDAAPYQAWIKNKVGKYLIVNPALEQFCGKENGEIIGSTVFDILPDRIAVEYHTLDQTVMHSRKHQKVDHMYEEDSTGGKWLETYVIPVFDEQGEIGGTIGFSRKILKRKILEKELEEQQKFLKTMLDTIPDIIVYKDKQSAVLGCNKACLEKLYGVAEEDVIGKTALDILEDSALARRCLQNDQQTFAVGKTLKDEEKYILIDGNKIDVETKKTPYYDSQGEVAGLIAVSRDITERKRLARKLTEQKEYAELLLQVIPSGVVSLDRKGKIASWNQKAEEITGYTAAEVIGRDYFSFANEMICNDAPGLFGRSTAGTSNKICTIKPKQGETRRHILKNTTALTNDCGEIAGQIQCFYDITETVKIETELRESEKKFRYLAENINEVFMIRDRKKFLYISPAYDRITGHSRQGLLDNPRKMAETVYPDDRRRVWEVFILGGKRIQECICEEFRFVLPTGEVRWAWLRSYPIGDQKGSVIQKAIVIADITERKRMEVQLRKREEENQRELDLAAKVQQAALPPPFVGKKVRVNTVFSPYHMVSGDLVNYKWFEEQQKLRGYVVDVCGHGVATALQTATVKMLLDNQLFGDKEIGEADFQFINRTMIQYLYEESFAALIYFEFDFAASILTIISGGINLFLAARGQQCQLLPVYSCYLGLLDNADVKIVKLPFKPGEIYGMMSDGASDLIEAQGVRRQGNFAGYLSWFEKLLQSPERSDDFSAVCIEILPAHKELSKLAIRNSQELTQAQAEISEFLGRHMPDEAIMLEVAVNEAVHNGLRAGGNVCVKLRRIGGRLVIRVKDDGPGFDTGKINAKLNLTMSEAEYNAEFEQKILAENGRGILLMKMLCDRLIYNTKGNEVLLMKKIEE